MASENESIGFRIADRHVKGANSALAREIDAAIRDVAEAVWVQHREQLATRDRVWAEKVRDAQERQREACAVALAKVKIQLNSSSGRVATHDFHGLADVVRALPLVCDEPTSTDTPAPVS